MLNNSYTCHNEVAHYMGSLQLLYDALPNEVHSVFGVIKLVHMSIERLCNMPGQLLDYYGDDPPDSVKEFLAKFDEYTSKYNIVSRLYDKLQSELGTPMLAEHSYLTDIRSENFKYPDPVANQYFITLRKENTELMTDLKDIAIDRMIMGDIKYAS